MSVTSGLTFAMPFATWDRDSRCWKTSEVTSLWALTLSSLTLPTSGGLRSGSLYERPTSVPPIDVSGCSFLPTPAVNDMGGNKTIEWWDEWAPRQKASDGRVAGHGRSLSIEVRRQLLPTPRAQNGEHRNQNIWARDPSLPQNLENALALLPTPVADHSRGLPSEGTDYSSLPNAVVALLPTPSVADGMGGHLTRSGDRSGELLLPGVAVSIGAPTPPPSNDGSESSDVPLPFPPSQGEPGHHDSPPPSWNG
jgi:hypothetical protein